jgi:hypothetical protein
MTRVPRLVIACLVGVVCLNLAWEHQALLTPMVTIQDYYDFHARAPLIFRMLPALLCRVLLGAHTNAPTGLNAPLDSHYAIFQVVLDAISLSVAFAFMVRIARQLNPRLNENISIAVAAAAGIMIVVFGYFMVPNKALFYPYDFTDLCIASGMFYLCIRGGSLLGLWLPLAVFLATLNKETAVFYSGLYLVFSIDRKQDWKRTGLVLLACAASFVLARTTVLMLLRRLSGDISGAPQFEMQLLYTLSQLKNPLLLFALLNICSYLYVAVWAIRKRLDRTDMLILGMVLLWILIMSTVGIFRQLRLYVPASLMLYVILCRHLTQVVDALIAGAHRNVPRSAVHGNRVVPPAGATTTASQTHAPG